LSVSDGRGVDIEEEKRGTLLEVDFVAEIFCGWIGESEDGEGDHLKGETRVRTPPPFWFPALVGPRRVRVRSAQKTE